MEVGRRLAGAASEALLAVRQDGGISDAELRDSAAVRFFRGFSRFGQPSTFDVSEDYIRGVLYTGIPWLVLGAVVSFAAFVMIIVRFTCARKFFDYYDIYWATPSSKRRIIQGFLSVFLVQGAIACAAVAFMANYSVREQSQLVTEWVVAVTEKFVYVLSVALVFFEFVSKQVTNFVLFRIQRAPAITGVEDVRAIMSSLSVNALIISARAESITRDAVNQLTDLSSVINVASLVVFFTLIGVIAFTMLGPMFMTCYTMTRSTCTRVLALLSFLLPLVVAWVVLAATVMIGVASADVCHMATEFTIALRYANDVSAQLPSDEFNYLAEELSCPTLSDLQEPHDNLRAQYDSIRQELAAATGINVQTLDDFVGEIGLTVSELSTCSILLTFMDRWFSWLCDDTPVSVMNSVLSLFISYLVMCFLLTAMWLVALFGVDLSTYATVWPIWKDKDLDGYRDSDREDEIEGDAYPEDAAGANTAWVESQYDQEDAHHDAVAPPHELPQETDGYLYEGEPRGEAYGDEHAAQGVAQDAEYSHNAKPYVAVDAADAYDNLAYDKAQPPAWNT